MFHTFWIIIDSYIEVWSPESSWSGEVSTNAGVCPCWTFASSCSRDFELLNSTQALDFPYIHSCSASTLPRFSFVPFFFFFRSTLLLFHNLTICFSPSLPFLPLFGPSFVCPSICLCLYSKCWHLLFLFTILLFHLKKHLLSAFSHHTHFSTQNDLFLPLRDRNAAVKFLPSCPKQSPPPLQYIMYHPSDFVSMHARLTPQHRNNFHFRDIRVELDELQ